MPKQDGNIKIVESFITSNKPMSLNNKNIYYNEYSDEVLIRYYQTLIAVRKDKSVRILEGINNYSASTNVLVRLIERIAKEKGCTVSYVKQFAKGSTIGKNRYKVAFYLTQSDDTLQSAIISAEDEKEAKYKVADLVKDLYGDYLDYEVTEVVKYAKGSTINGGNAYVVNYFKEDISDVETIVVVANSEDEAKDKAYDLVGGFDDVADIEEMTIAQAKSMGLLSKDKYAKGSTVGGKKYQYYILQTKDGKVNWVVPKKIATIEEIVENAKKYNINIFASNFGTWESKRENGNRYTTEIVNEDGSDFKTDKEYNEISRSIGVVKKVKYAKGSTVKGKDFSGNYYSTNDFVGAHNLQKQAEKIFGKGWEAEDDVNQIENIINSIGGKYVVTVPEDRSQWNEMREQYDLANPTNDSNYDIFVISESDFKYAKGSTVKGKGGASFFDIYDEESGKTLLVKAYSLEQAEGISETIDFDDYENGQEVDMLDDIANYEAEEYAKGSTLKNANSDSEKFELKVLQALSGYNNGREENGIMEGLGLSNYRFNQYASKQEVAKVEKTLKALIKNKYIEEGGIGYKITKIGANHLRSFNYGSYGNGGGVAVSSESGLAFGTNAELLMNEQNLQYADGGAVGMYSIRVWESEDDRDMGESFIIEKVSDKYEAKEKAKKMYQKNDLAAVEVEDENGDTLLHLSSDGIEEYAKGGNMSIGFNYEIGGL